MSNSNSQSVSTAAPVAPKRGRAEGSVYRFSVTGGNLVNKLMMDAMDFKGNPLPTIEDLRFRPVPDAPVEKQRKDSTVYMRDLKEFIAKCDQEKRTPTPDEFQNLMFVENQSVSAEFNLVEAVEHFGDKKFDVSLTELYRPLNALIEAINNRKEQIKELWTEAHHQTRRNEQDAATTKAAQAAAGK